jgi:hypothetical protein
MMSYDFQTKQIGTATGILQDLVQIQVDISIAEAERGDYAQVCPLSPPALKCN